MKIAKVLLKSESPYSSSVRHSVPKKNKEEAAEYEERTWREKGHYNTKGVMIIPGVKFKNALSSTSKFLSEKIPGRGNQLYTKHIVSGVQVVNDIILPVKKTNVESVSLWQNSRGQKGGPLDVLRTFPIVDTWKGELTFVIVDDLITKDIFERYLKQAGTFIGIGRWRPEKGGSNGRFSVCKITWSEK